MHEHGTTAVRAVVGAAICLLLLAARPAGADEPIFGGNDWFASAAGVTAFDATGADGARPSGGARISAGFRFNRWFASEVGAEWAQRIQYDRGTGPSRCTGGRGDANHYLTWQVTGGGRLYFTEGQVQPFLLGGAGFMQTFDGGGGKTCSGDAFVARMGGGVDVFVTNGLAVSLIGAYVLPEAGGASGHDYVSLSLGFTWY